MLQIFRSKYEWIFDYTIYGERHSGTNFLESCIKQQFGLDITYFYGFKHFFGWTKPEILTYKARHTLFLGITRHPYDWILALQRHPHHIPKENLKFPDFLLNEWYSVRGKIELLEDRNYTNKQRYKNIFELRKEKCIYLSEILPVIINNYVLMSYDDLKYNHYQTMNIIGNRFNLKTIGTPPPFYGKDPIELSPEIKDIIDNNIDWKVEATLGYFPK
jgi:hypothetical protein